jgi:hypothetical protein
MCGGAKADQLAAVPPELSFDLGQAARLPVEDSDRSGTGGQLQLELRLTAVPYPVVLVAQHGL